MVERIGISEGDLQLLLGIVDRTRTEEAGEHLPESLLRDLAVLVPFDEVMLQLVDPERRTITEVDLTPPPRPDGAPAGSCPPRLWKAWGATGSAHTEPSVAVRPPVPARSAHSVVVEMPPDGPIDRSLVLWRFSGPAFSERDVRLLTLLRPHLVDEHDRHQGRQLGAPELTERQWEILRMVAAGSTNGQIARRLGLSEATVRKHLENTYARLGVTNRTAAVGRTRLFLSVG